MKMARSRLAFAVFVLLLLASVGYAQPLATEPEPDEAPPGGDFTLHSEQGAFHLADLRGKTVLLFFGYTRCPVVCPMGLANMAAALRGFSDAELARVQPLFVTLDPDRDDVKTLGEYVRYFHDRLIGLSGSAEEVARAAARYGVVYYRVEMPDSALGYAVNHSAATYLIGPDGQLRFLFPHAVPPATIAEAVRYVLDSRSASR